MGRGVLRCLTPSLRLSYVLRMPENISFRLRRSKRELRAAFGNISKKINELIERELQPANDWRDVLKRPRPELPDEEFEQWIRPE